MRACSTFNGLSAVFFFHDFNGETIAEIVLQLLLVRIDAQRHGNMNYEQISTIFRSSTVIYWQTLFLFFLFFFLSLNRCRVFDLVAVIWVDSVV